MEKTDKEPKDLSDFLGEGKEKTSASFLTQPSYSSKSKSSSATTTVLLLMVLMLLGIAGVFGWRYFSGDNFSKAAVNPAPSVTEAPTPKPTRNLVRSEWTFEVLNGSTISGEAKRIADKLSEKGYTVVKVGNASKNNYGQNEVYLREGKETDVDLLLADLKDFNVSSVSGKFSEGTASARLILGGE